MGFENLDPVEEIPGCNKCDCIGPCNFRVAHCPGGRPCSMATSHAHLPTDHLNGSKKWWHEHPKGQHQLAVPSPWRGSRYLRGKLLSLCTITGLTQCHCGIAGGVGPWPYLFASVMVMSDSGLVQRCASPVQIQFFICTINK